MQMKVQTHCKISTLTNHCRFKGHFQIILKTGNDLHFLTAHRTGRILCFDTLLTTKYHNNFDLHSGSR